MEVDIQDGDACSALIAQILRGDRRIIEKAVSAVQVSRRVMPRRAAQGERRARSPVKMICRRHGHLGGRPRRLPGPGADRGLPGHCVVAELAGDVVRAPLRHTARRPAVRYRLAQISGGDPIGPSARQEFDELDIVHPQNRRQAVALRRPHLAETDGADPLEHHLGALRAFVGPDQLAAVQFGLGISPGHALPRIR